MTFLESWFHLLFKYLELPQLWSKFLVEASLLPLFVVILLVEWFLSRPNESSISKMIPARTTHTWDLISTALFIFGIRRFLSNLFLFGTFAFLMTFTPRFHQGIFESSPLWIQVPLALVINDFLVYWSHRFKHSSPWLWHTHEFHHSSTEVSTFTSFRVHPLDYAVYYVAIFLPMIVLFGPNPIFILTLRWILAVPGYLSHARIDSDLGILGKIIVSPRYHHLHHELGTSRNSNFSNGLVVWDRLFGTYAAPKRSIFAIQPGIEVNSYDREVSWKSYLAPVLGFYTYPIRKLKRSVSISIRRFIKST